MMIERKLALLFLTLMICLSVPFSAFAAETGEAAQLGGTGTTNNPYGWITNKTDNTLDPIEQKVKGAASSIYRVLQYAALGVSAICVIVGLIMLAPGGRTREEGKGKIAAGLIIAFGVGCCIWALTTLFNVGLGMG